MEKHKYISLLRGINVGGKRKILMKDLKELYQEEDVENLQTYIQSGNVLFESSQLNTTNFSNTIKEKIKQVYGFDVPVITIDLHLLKNVEKKNLYLHSDVDISTLHLTFLSELPSVDKKENISSPIKGDEFQIYQQFIFIKCQGKYSQSKLTNQFFEKKLSVEATTRNWKTVQKLIALHN